MKSLTCSCPSALGQTSAAAAAARDEAEEEDDGQNDHDHDDCDGHAAEGVPCHRDAQLPIIVARLHLHAITACWPRAGSMTPSLHGVLNGCVCYAVGGRCCCLLSTSSVRS